MRSLSRLAAAAVHLALFIGLAELASERGSWSAAGYLLGLSAIVVARALGARRRWYLVGVLCWLSTAGLRIALAQQGRTLRLESGRDGAARVIDRLVDERDLAVSAARAMRGVRALAHVGIVADPDVDTLPAVMSSAYARLAAAEGEVPSPVVATLLGLQRPGASDTLAIGDPARATGTVLFLHGFSGSFTLPCWVIGRAAAKAGFATVCPATSWRGDWWSPTGSQIISETLNDLRRQGARRIVLAGLSNGAFEASRLVGRAPDAFAGALLISGAAEDATAVSIPVLALQGRRDAVVPAALTRSYAERTGARYLELPGGHFALLTSEPEASAAISAWLTSEVGSRGDERRADRRTE